MNIKELYSLWMEKADAEYKTELSAISDEKEINDRFYRCLEFGTAGLRGVLGAGTNRMNTHVVRQATKALSDYILSINDGKTVCIAYDSRRMSREFAHFSALVLCKNGITVYLFPSLRPVPMLSFAVRYMNAQAGIVITASHNPPEYNGYKVYWSDGGQITPDRCIPISDLIEKTDMFAVESMTEAEAREKGLLIDMPSEVDEAYYTYTMSLSVSQLSQKDKGNVNIVYTPLHGSGLIPVTTVLDRMGYNNVYVVKEQEKPDGDFPTVKAPNPENTENFDLAIKLAKAQNADIVLGTDPDSDRVGVCVRTDDGYRALTGNQIGAILAYYILSAAKQEGKLPDDAYIVRSIVSTPLCDEICAYFGVEMRKVLTGFRYIAEQIEKGKGNFMFGFEESYGYLAGTSVRDKDAVLASMLCAEACCFYKKRGQTLIDCLHEIYDKFGAYAEKTLSFSVSGMDGMEKLSHFMDSQHKQPPKHIGGMEITSVTDYLQGVGDIPRANVVTYDIGENVHITLRPSGTEPKLKLYVAVKADTEREAQALINRICEVCSGFVKEHLGI